MRKDYWKSVLAPKLKDRKDELGRKVPEREIAASVESSTGQPSTRALISLWLLGLREPTVTQFVALCQKLELDHLEVLADTPTRHRRPAIQGQEGNIHARNPDKKTTKKSRSSAV